MSEGEYRVGIICKNCGCCDDVYIKIGRTVEEHLRLVSIICDNCKLRVKKFEVRHKVIFGNQTSYI